jgi:hypothetical protein
MSKSNEGNKGQGGKSGKGSSGSSKPEKPNKDTHKDIESTLYRSLNANKKQGKK